MRAAPFHGQKLVTWKFGHIGLLNAWKEEEIFCEKCFSAHFSDFCGVFFFLFISLFFFLSSFPLPFFFFQQFSSSLVSPEYSQKGEDYLMRIYTMKNTLYVNQK